MPHTKLVLLSACLSLLLFVSLPSFAIEGRLPKGKITVSTGKFRDWEFAPSEIFGIGLLDNTQNRYYYKIAKINDSLVQVERHNPAEVILTKTMLYFSNGAIHAVKEVNQWGEEYSQEYFTNCGEGEYYVTKKVRGENSYLPCKKARFIYKENLLKEIRYFDDSGASCTCGNGAAILRYKKLSDKNRFSKPIETSSYDETDSPAVSTISDCHKVLYEYDENGNKLNEKYFGTDGLPVANRFGMYGLQYPPPVLYHRYDEESLGPQYQIANNILGIAVVESVFSDKNFLVTQTRFDSKFKITRSSPAMDGVAITQYKRDDKGNETEKTFYDEQNKPINNTHGYQKVASVYSARNMLTDVSYFDFEGRPFSDDINVHHYKYDMDSIGRVITVKYFDKQDQPNVDILDRVYEKKYAYDDFGRRVSESYWRANGEPMNRWNGYHESRTKFNDDGRPVEVGYLDENGNYIKTNTGYSLQKIEYNKRGLIAMRSYFDGCAAIVLHGSGNISNFHAIKYGYDSSRRLNVVEYLDTANAPTDASIQLGINNLTCQKVEFFYNGVRIMQEKLYKTDATLPPVIINCLRERYISSSGVGTVAPNK
jgi:hypothetical protein